MLKECLLLLIHHFGCYSKKKKEKELRFQERKNQWKKKEQSSLHNSQLNSVQLFDYIL